MNYQPPRIEGDMNDDDPYTCETHRQASQAAMDSPWFTPEALPDGARLVLLDEVRKGECHWPIDTPAGGRFCAAPADVEAESSVLRRRYCEFHGKIAVRNERQP